MRLKIGADPEFFLKRRNKHISGFGVIPGTKEKPYKVDKGAIQVDGMALEFNIHPAETPECFVINIQTVLKILRDMVPKTMSFSFTPVAVFTPEYIEKQHPMARALGCSPDWNAYTTRENTPPDDTSNIRTAAGHIHIGWKEKNHNLEHIEECIMLVKQLDYMLGIPSILLDPVSRRREMYGKAGCFRPKPYGVEYRVLSNFWLKNKKYMSWVFMQTKLAYDLLVKKNIYFPEKYGDIAREIIDNNDIIGAKKFISQNMSKALI